MYIIFRHDMKNASLTSNGCRGFVAFNGHAYTISEFIKRCFYNFSFLFFPFRCVYMRVFFHLFYENR